MKRIAIDARFLLRRQRGMPTYVSKLCSILPLKQPEDLFYFFINSEFEHNDLEENYLPRLKKLALLENVRVIDSRSKGEIYWEWIQLPRLLRKHKIELLHMPGNRVCLMTLVPQVVTFHDANEWISFSLLRGLESTNTIGTNMRSVIWYCHIWLNYFFGMKKVKSIITVSKYSMNSIIESFPKVRKKIGFVYHGLPDTFDGSFTIKKREDRKHILMLGGDSSQKNCENAILAYAELPNGIRNQYPLVILGFVGSEQSVLIKTIEDSNIVDNVKIFGWQPDEVIVDSFSDALAFLFVSKLEGFGFPLIQAFKMGTPVVTSRAEVLLEVAKGATLNANYDDPEQIGKLLFDLISDFNIWEHCHSKGLERASDFDWDDVATYISNNYKELLSTEKDFYE